MPTSIAIYKFGSKAKDEYVNCIQSLFDFYAVAIIVVLSLIALETYLGFFDGLSIAHAVLRATMTDMMPDQFVGIL